MVIRREWRSASQAEPSVRPFSITELVSQRRSMWPSVLELRQVFRRDERSDVSRKGDRRKGGGKGDPRNRTLSEKKWYAKEGARLSLTRNYVPAMQALRGVGCLRYVPIGRFKVFLGEYTVLYTGLKLRGAVIDC